MYLYVCMHVCTDQCMYVHMCVYILYMYIITYIDSIYLNVPEMRK